MSLLQRWRAVLAEYRLIKRVTEDVVDIVSALAFTTAVTLLGTAIAGIIGGSHG